MWWKPAWQTQGKCWEKSVWQAKARARGEQRQGESKSKRQKGKGQKAEEKGQGRARAACQKLWKALHEMGQNPRAAGGGHPQMQKENWDDLPLYKT